MTKFECSLCGKPVEGRKLFSPQKLENPIVEIIKRERPDWAGTRGICPECHEQYRAKKFVDYLEREYAKISEMEKSLVTQVARRGRVSKLVNVEFEAQMTLGQRVADRVARFGGSWTFIGIFGGILLAWMGINTWVLVTRPFDPYPFILLNLMAEVEIRDLHDKLDGLLFKQWHELWHMQQRQLELLEHLHKELSHPDEVTAEPEPYRPPEM